MFAKLLVLSAVAVAAVNAQTPCIIACTVGAATINNCTLTDLPCLCQNQQFQGDVLGCLNTNCPTDIPAAVSIQGAQCTTGSTTLVTTGAAPTTTHSVPFSLPSGSATSGAAESSGASGSGSASGTATATTTGTGAGASSGSATVTTPATSSAAESTPATSAAETSSTPSSAADSLVTNGGLTAIFAMIAGILAI